MNTTDSFGYCVRRRRKALDLTQEELAQRVGCAAVTLRKIEADERRPSSQMARRLAVCLALPDEEYPTFMATAAGQQTPAELRWLASPDVHRSAGNLPAPLTSLVGRAVEIAAIADCLRQEGVRLLTLTGPVGVGKTRLALEVSRLLHEEDYRDGIYLVALAPVQDPALVPSAMATALGVREARDCDLTRSMMDYLANRKTLLIFDNFEHLLPATLFLSSLLAACPGLQVLVTSRIRLHIYGEHEFVVSPLPLPARDDPLGALGTAAVRLFCDRARATRPGFQLTPCLTPVIAEICQRLDGLPLAIELAAARLKLLTPHELLERLEHRLLVLSQDSVHQPHHRQGLQNAIAWSYGLLSPVERILLARVAVFVGGFSLTTAEAICTFPHDEQVFHSGDTTTLASPDIASGIHALLDQSLLVRLGAEAATSFTVTGCCGHCPLRTLQETADAESRFSMLEIIREFALDQLRISGELEVMQRRHAEYYAAWAEQAEAQLNGPNQVAWLARLEQEADNLRAALTWLLAAGLLPIAASMACALGAFWQRHGHYSEGRRWVEKVLTQMVQTPVPDTLRACVLQTAASLAYRQGDWQTAQQWLGESMTLFQADADQRGMARVLFDLGWVAVDKAEWEEAARLNEESLTLARAAGDACAMYQALTNLGWTRLCIGAWESGAVLFEEAHALARRAGHVKGVAVSLVNLGWIALHQGDTGRAAALARDSVHLGHLLGEREVLAECLEILADAAAIEGNVGRAIELRGAAEALWEELHVTRPPTQYAAAPHGRVNMVMPHLTGDAFAAALRHGRSLSPDAMVAYALDCGGVPARG